MKKPNGGQLLVDEIRMKFTVIIYRIQHRRCLITVFESHWNKCHRSASHSTLRGDFTDCILQFKFDRSADFILATKISTYFKNCLPAVKYMLPSTLPEPITGPIRCTIDLPMKRLLDLIDLQKQNPSVTPIESINVLRLGGRFAPFYLGKIRSWRIYRDFFVQQPDECSTVVIAVTRNCRLPRAVLLHTGLSKAWMNAQRMGEGLVHMLPSGRLAINMRVSTEEGHLSQKFQLLGNYPARMLKKCGNCKNSDVHLKICRICKKKDHHLQWWKTPCHFCSSRCFKAGWNEHKKRLH